jgi:hypothetical protein
VVTVKKFCGAGLWRAATARATTTSRGSTFLLRLLPKTTKLKKGCLCRKKRERRFPSYKTILSPSPTLGRYKLDRLSGAIFLLASQIFITKSGELAQMDHR